MKMRFVENDIIAREDIKKKSITKYKKELLINFKDKKCEQCKKEFDIEQFEIHRINPELGYSDFRNLKVICVECHKILTSAQNMAKGILK